jgi:hypothetical protein
MPAEFRWGGISSKNTTSRILVQYCTLMGKEIVGTGLRLVARGGINDI